MVSDPRLRSILSTLCLYVMAALLIGYFGINAYTGDHGLRAKKDLDREIAELSVELKQYVDKSDENVLSLEVIRKADEIEKLAKSVKDKMKGPN